jgi:cytochrome oxidase Cu insertion factor (SCO1/SenC/PrrC family)
VLRLIRWTASLLVVLLAAFWGIIWLARANPDSHAASLLHALAGQGPPAMSTGTEGAFALVEPNGHKVTDRDFRGRWMLIYFGYTYCPDVCPTTLQSVSNVLDQLGDQAAQIAPIFITVDPDRDTPKVMGDYVALFDSRLIGLTGSPAQIAGAKSAYGVFSQRTTSSSDGGYLIDHSAYMYFVGPDGKLKALFQAGTTEADMVAVIGAALSGRS